MKYDYVKTLYWKNLRKKLVYDNKKARCAGCGYKENKSYLHMHHKNYENVGQETKKDLIIMCQFCHNFIENYKKQYGYEKFPLSLLSQLGKLKKGYDKMSIGEKKKLFTKYGIAGMAK